MGIGNIGVGNPIIMNVMRIDRKSELIVSNMRIDSIANDTTVFFFVLSNESIKFFSDRYPLFDVGIGLQF